MTLRANNIKLQTVPADYETPRHGYYETLIQNMAGNTCLDHKPHCIVTLQRPSAHSTVPLLGKTVYRKCGKVF